ncbi:EF-hand domain-containing protein [Streptomyces anulatus]|uniref:EF-hand domain-containing protein n=1 Tax=Streptomyces TaxID=1883 RepID=UPI000BFD745C|nr:MULTISPECIES: EF-hand domain-containing protein [Streptomyces]MCX4502181.1 EF-hand domain-containing protein [Streptomyces anulatus]WTC75283.1 EF-hand domain-containing protein [Streptomyces anulatus]WUD87330.1 EF-hand domain-containing protein [Streptomyces anulatus]
MVFGLCDIADTGGDFSLDKDEFVRFAEVLGGDEERALSAFTELDHGNGVISRQEMFNAFRDYLHGRKLVAMPWKSMNRKYQPDHYRLPWVA